MDFNDLARSGTAPEPSKAKANQMAGHALPLRPKTRSAENDMQDFRIELRTNKINYQQYNYPADEGNCHDDPADNQSNEFIRAMESYQADFESWSRGRTDFDPSGMSNSNARQGTAIGGRRSAKDGKKVQSSALSAYTQNIPQIVLQTSKKSSKPTSSPRTTREQKTDVKADIRAVYGADITERINGPSPRPRSQKQSTTGASNPNSPKVSEAFSFPEEAGPPSPERREFVSNSQSADYEPNISKTTPSSASRLRASVAQHSSDAYPVNTATAAAIKPFSIRKAVPSTSSGSRQVTRPFSHTEGVRTSVSQGATAGTPVPRASLDTPTSSSSSKRVARKSATNTGSTPASLLKSSLVPGGSTRGTSGRSDRCASNKGSESEADYIENDSNTDFSDTSEHIAKQRASDQKGASQGVVSVGIAGAGNIPKFHSSSTSSDNRDNKPPLAGKSPTKDNPTMRGYSPSPTLYLDNLNLGKVDSDQALLDIIQDTDNLECSFDESPILAAYLQQKSHTSHATSQKENPVPDGSTRPQSRKLYLGAEKEVANHTTFSPKDTKAPSYKTAPRSAGARYPVPHAPKATTTTSSSGADTVTTSSSGFEGPAPPLRKMSSFNEIIHQSRKWHEIPPSSNLPDQRPPSRQSSAFPVHLADEPSGNKTVSVRADENKLSKRTSSPTTAARGVASPPVRPSMRWDRVDLDHDDNDDGEIEEALHHVLSDTSSADENPTKYNTKSNAYSSAKNNASTSSRTSPTTGYQAVAPARTHIGIVRAAPVEDRPDTAVGADLYTPEYPTIQRPPSRQKIAAQHLFEGGPPPPSRAGTVTADATRSSRAATAGNPTTDSQPMSRSATRPSTSHYNPRDDGFTELDTDEAAAVPFVIKFNSSEANDFEEVDLDELAINPSRSQANYDRDTGPRRKSQSNAPGHSRSPSNTSNNWADFADEGLAMASPGYRPQTIGSSVKAPRLLGVIPPTGLAPPRTKSAGEVLVRSPGVPLRREGNNAMVSPQQQPHAPAGSTSLGRNVGPGTYGNHVLRENIKAGLSDYTAGPPPHRALNSGWTDAPSSHGSPRAQV